MSEVNASSPADADPNTSADRGKPRAGSWPVLAVISAGGVTGALSRYGLTAAYPHRLGEFPWTIFAINVTGCLLIGVLMALLTEVWPGRRLLRPFLGVGVLGGFTTFSTYAVDIVEAIDAGAVPVAMAYLAGTLVSALVAVWAGSAATNWTIDVRRQAALTPREEES